jgi:hypothetical protein
MLWQNGVMIAGACIVCGFMGTQSIWTALVVGPFMILISAVGGFYDVMDLTGWTMLVAPSAAALLGAGAGIWWRRTHPPEPDFVPPPPPPGKWAEYDKRQQERRDQSFGLYDTPSKREKMARKPE